MTEKTVVIAEKSRMVVTYNQLCKYKVLQVTYLKLLHINEMLDPIYNIHNFFHFVLPFNAVWSNMKSNIYIFLYRVAILNKLYHSFSW